MTTYEAITLITRALTVAALTSIAILLALYLPVLAPA